MKFRFQMRLEQAVGEAERQDVLRSFLPRKWSRIRKISALRRRLHAALAVTTGLARSVPKGVFHYDSACARRKPASASTGPPQGGTRAVTSNICKGRRLSPTNEALGRLDVSSSSFRRRRLTTSGDVGQDREKRPVGPSRPCGWRLNRRFSGDPRKSSASISSSETPMILQPGDET